MVIGKDELDCNGGKRKTNIIKYRDYKSFSNEAFMNDLQYRFSKVTTVLGSKTNY